MYWKARRVGSSTTNSAVAVLAAAILPVIAVVGWHLGSSPLPTAALGGIVLQVAETGFTFTTAILGFLITGFSVFSSITRPEIFAALAKLPHTDGDISRLKFIFFNFLLVFIHYVAFLGLSIAVIIVASGLPSPVAHIIRLKICGWDGAIYCLIVFATSVTIGWLAFLVMLLKSFIWNIYQAVLVVITTGDLLAQIEADRLEAERERQKQKG